MTRTRRFEGVGRALLLYALVALGVSAYGLWDLRSPSVPVAVFLGDMWGFPLRMFTLSSLALWVFVGAGLLRARQPLYAVVGGLALAAYLLLGAFLSGMRVT